MERWNSEMIDEIAELNGKVVKYYDIMNGMSMSKQNAKLLN